MGSGAGVGLMPTVGSPRVDQPKREDVIEVLQAIVRNDETYFDHHQARRWDGKAPRELGVGAGTIWLTPREIASTTLRALGAVVPNPIEEMKAEVAARSGPRCVCDHGDDDCGGRPAAGDGPRCRPCQENCS